MAPELLLGEDPGPETDIFALGCITHSALTGRPFKTPMSDIDEVRIDAYPDEPVRTFLRKSLLRRRDKRLADAEVFAKEADALVNSFGPRPSEWEMGQWIQNLIEETAFLNRPRQTFAEMFSVGSGDGDSPREPGTAVTTLPLSTDRPPRRTKGG